MQVIKECEETYGKPYGWPYPLLMLMMDMADCNNLQGLVIKQEAFFSVQKAVK